MITDPFYHNFPASRYVHTCAFAKDLAVGPQRSRSNICLLLTWEVIWRWFRNILDSTVRVFFHDKKNNNKKTVNWKRALFSGQMREFRI